MVKKRFLEEFYPYLGKAYAKLKEREKAEAKAEAEEAEKGAEIKISHVSKPREPTRAQITKISETELRPSIMTGYAKEREEIEEGREEIDFSKLARDIEKRIVKEREKVREIRPEKVPKTLAPPAPAQAETVLPPAPRPPTPLEEVRRKLPPAPRAPIAFPKAKPVMPKFADIDLGRVNHFLIDPKVSMVECEGAGITIKIHKEDKVIETETTLSEEEIEQVITSFAREARVKITGPVFRASIENLEINAVTSKLAGLSFIIRKT